MTPLCDSDDHAWDELDRMLNQWAEIAKSGQPMTSDQSLDIFGGPNGENKSLLKRFSAEVEKQKATVNVAGSATKGRKASTS